MLIQSTTVALYNQDFCLWVETTVKQLQLKQFETVDWENLIEEIQDLSGSQKRALESLLTRLFEHLLKIGYWKSELQDNANHWKGEIRTFRKQINKLLKVSPSLRPYLQDIFAECYQDAREIIADVTGLPVDTFPVHPLASLDQVLDENWLPEI
ncbi:MAG: DUF29 domain-containing protein [Gloeotrichia echinulata IR180]|jgi:hypothetical protein|nr:DUF29 domain-containing protein [Gloeotrichia echinulata DEX184]